MTIDTKSFSEIVLEQASAWIVRLRSDLVSEQDQQDFALWLAESPEHQAAFDEMMVLWEAMGSHCNAGDRNAAITALMGQVSAKNSPGASNDGEVLHPSSVNPKPNSATRRQLSATPMPRYPQPIPWFASFAALAASVLVVALVYFTSNPPLRSELKPQQTLYATPIGKQQRFTLEDGSVLELNTGSQVAVSYQADVRHLELLQGEAFFSVHPNPERPFIVSAGAARVTAVGTAFNIKLDSDEKAAESMAVAVTEGHVAVANDHHQTVAVALGQQTRVDGKGKIGAVEAADLTIVSAWRGKTLIFRTTDLATALTELNRYLPQPVDTSDPSLSNLNITGTFSLEEPDVTLDAIIQAFNLQSYKNPFDNKRRLYLR